MIRSIEWLSCCFHYTVYTRIEVESCFSFDLYTNSLKTCCPLSNIHKRQVEVFKLCKFEKSPPECSSVATWYIHVNFCTFLSQRSCLSFKVLYPPPWKFEYLMSISEQRKPKFAMFLSSHIWSSFLKTSSFEYTKS